MRTKQTAVIRRQDPINEEIFRILLETEASQEALPGQFLQLFCDDGAHLLGRPISIAKIGKESGTLMLVYRVCGFGTKELSKKKEGDTVDFIGPLGNGFPVDFFGKEQKSSLLLIGGGIGIPPLWEAADAYGGPVTAVLGFTDEPFLADAFTHSGAQVYIASESGAAGTKGNVLDAIKENGLTGDVILSCGPMPMLAAVKRFAAERQIPCFVSLEERMACGVGACLGCVVETTQRDDHSMVKNARVCADGPVFDAREVVL